MNEFLLIIDGSSLLSTQFFGNLPPAVLMAKTPEEKALHFHKIMQTSKGVYTNAVYGFLRTLLKITEEQKPTHLAVTWDLSRDTFRREMYPEYKANRSEILLPLKEQFALCQEVLTRIGVKQYMDERYEADDFSGSLNEKFCAEIPVCILTKDHDYLQLAAENTTIWLLQSNQGKADELYAKYSLTKEKANAPEKTFPMTPELIEREYGVSPSSIASLKGLQGDSSDNIKGVPGIGPQTAVALMHYYKTIASLYEAIHASGKEGEKALVTFWKDSLGIKRNPMSFLCKESDTELVGEKAAFLSEDLATIRRTLPIEESLDDLRLVIDRKSLRQVFHELEITSISLSSEDEDAKNYSLSIENIHSLDEAETWFAKHREANEIFGVAISTEDDVPVVHIAIGQTVTNVYCEQFISTEYVSERLYELCEHATVGTCNIKAMCTLFPVYHKHLFDVALADYLLRPLDARHEEDTLWAEWCPSLPEPKDGVHKADLYVHLTERLSAKMKEIRCDSLYRDIEQPLIWVLSAMEREGIRVDSQQLKLFSEELHRLATEEEKTIYELAGETFNINSPKQLGDVLFGKLMLPRGKKTKSGYSTSADILEGLRAEYPIVAHVLQYRQYMKLYSTYAEGLQTCISEDGRIHTTFQQMVTATGRLSSTDPNLQNIPIRTELGRLLRKVFVPRDGCLFVDADYSQIELRLMAHISGDQALIQAYRDGEDIHRHTAASVLGIPYEAVTAEQRSAAKAVNFGIIYGISSYSLSQDLGITKKMADEYIARYFEKYPGVKAYLDNTVAQAMEEGQVTTAYGRIRPIPELSSSNFMQRSFGERVAMNSPIQGTAADIMKLAMLRVDEALKKQRLNSRMLVQVHDELLLEVPFEEEKAVTQLLKQAMEGAAELSVPLIADVHTGSNWYEAK